MRVYTVHTPRNSVTVETLAQALDLIKWHHRSRIFHGPIYLRSHTTDFITV